MMHPAAATAAQICQGMRPVLIAGARTPAAEEVKVAVLITKSFAGKLFHLELYEQSSYSCTRISLEVLPMARAAQAVDLLRRKPKQARAQDTVEVIFEATARILRKEGREALNTNYIAECAGISVGTLYQYFPDKESILVAIARRELDADCAAVVKAISEPGDAGTD